MDSKGPFNASSVAILPGTEQGGEHEGTFPVLQAIKHLQTKVLHGVLPPDWTGVEWWIQVYKAGKGLAFHFDKDELLFKESGRMEHPILSSVLYLTGESTGTPLGVTVVVDQQFDSTQGAPTPECPSRCVLLIPRANRLALFDGRLGHGVLDSPSTAPRVTLLLNWWRQKPKGVNLPSHDLLHSCQDSRPSAAKQNAALEHGHMLSAEAIQDLPQRDGGDAVSGATPRLGLQRLLRVPPENGDESRGVISVDHLLESSGVNISGVGQDVVAAVAIEHPSYQLYPLLAEEQEKEHFMQTQVAAALVANSIMDGNEDQERGSTNDDLEQ